MICGLTVHGLNDEGALNKTLYCTCQRHECSHGKPCPQNSFKFLSNFFMVEYVYVPQFICKKQKIYEAIVFY